MSDQVIYRSCPLCEAHCGVAVELDRESGAVRTIRGDERDPLSGGYICTKAYGLKGLQEDPDQLRRPLRRTKRGFDEIDWESALDLVATRLREIREVHGPN